MWLYMSCNMKESRISNWIAYFSINNHIQQQLIKVTRHKIISVLSDFLFYFTRPIFISLFRCVQPSLGATWCQPRLRPVRRVTSPSSAWRWASPPSCSAPSLQWWWSSPRSTTTKSGNRRLTSNLRTEGGTASIPLIAFTQRSSHENHPTFTCVR